VSQASSGRSYPRYYEGVHRKRNFALVREAVERSGWRVLASTGDTSAPLFLGVESAEGERMALCVYAFTANSRLIKNRPDDEHRLQIKYGEINDETRAQNHSVAFDPLGSDVTLVLGAHEEDGVLIGLDPLVYNPLPMGISVEWKQADFDEILASGWHVWERDNISGSKRIDTRTPQGVETIVGFRAERLGDYIRLERDAQALHLDPALRFRSATAMAAPGSPAGLHALERQFELPSEDILDLIRERPRLGVAVRGGVAERHLELALEADPEVRSVELDESDGPPDVVATLLDGSEVTVECKNASPNTYADGTPKVETQKTRASKGDPTSRLYDPAQFDVLAVCMYGPTGRWEFRYKRSVLLARHESYPDRLKPIQKIDDSWATSLAEAVEQR
jgi:hypothetical protein